MPAAGATTATVVVTAVLVRPGQPDQPLPLNQPFDATQLAELPQDETRGSYYSATGFGPIHENTPGVALRELIVAAGVDPSVVDGVRVIPPVGQAGGALATSAGDLDEVGTATFPFTFNALPLVVTDQDNISLWIGQRTPASAAARPDLANARDFTVLDSQALTVQLQLPSTLAHPVIHTATETVNVRDAVGFTATVDDIEAANPKNWSWDFGDGGTDDSGSSVTHAFAAAGTYFVTTTVTDTTNGSSGVAPAQRIVVIDPSATSTPTTTPPPGPDAGTGGSNAPNVGPRTGSGARVGGAASGAPGRPGPTSDPRSASGAASGSGSAAAANGSVVGYLLSDAAQAAAAPRAGVVPRSNTAPAARAGLDATSLPGWAFGVVAVVLLAGLGAVSERRRPATHRARPRRKR